MKNLKLWLGVSLSVVAVGATLAGCSTEKKEGTATTAATGKPGEATPAKRGDVTVSMYDRGGVPASEGNYEENRWTKWINQNGPANVKFVPILRSDSTKKLNVLFASGSAPDIVNEYNTPFRGSLYDQKQLLPLDNILKYMPTYSKLLEQYPQLKKAGTKPDGKLYEIGKVKEAVPAHILLIRSDWLKKLNLSMPTTTEELFQVAKAFADQDPDGNGKKDTYGMNMSTYSEQAINEMFGEGSSSTLLAWGLKDGKVIRQWDNELASLTFKKMLYDDGIIDKDYINDKDGAKAKQDFLNGKIGIYVKFTGGWYDFVMNDMVTLKKNVAGAEIAPLGYPKSPLGTFTGAIDNPVQMTTVINAKAKDPEAVGRYLDFMMKPENAMKIIAGDEGTHWKKGSNGCPQTIDPAKSKNEVGYALDYTMFFSSGTDKCNYVLNQFSPDVPEQKAGMDMYKEVQKLYFDPQREYPGITLGDHMPVYSADLNIINTTILKEKGDLFVKAIISGSKYTPEQAIKDAQAAWDKAGGKQLEDFMNKWYQENKDNAFMAKDVKEIVKQQMEMVK
ncbi:extracellular solute-binding protein [Paenibacillus sp. GCM10023248]|uniref:extracellular solute-binding protein n=1 Tax=unclassified Paenibacillus TaxID=185978 RepID=UPI00237848C2|nr:extracellular solute-binding protein [Paenibacillus sp. MAHUQ-63]MDD9266559.1 extracellular solute-binding protein [Paenibacillus sp. MAHUQ-63]